MQVTNITITHNENIEIPAALKKPGVIILGKNRNSIKSELEKSELAFRVKFMTGTSGFSDISELIIISNEDYAEALKYALIAESKSIPHLLITTAVNGKFSVRLLHILYTDEQSEIGAVGAAVEAPQEIKDKLFSTGESYFVKAYGEGEYRLEEVFANLIDRLPNFDFAELFILLHCHPQDELLYENTAQSSPLIPILGSLATSTMKCVTDNIEQNALTAEAFGF
jgi:hypothetical protein